MKLKAGDRVFYKWRGKSGQRSRYEGLKGVVVDTYLDIDEEESCVIFVDEETIPDSCEMTPHQLNQLEWGASVWHKYNPYQGAWV